MIEGPITSHLGTKYGGANKSRPEHKGVDWGMPIGSPLVALIDGKLTPKKFGMQVEAWLEGTFKGMRVQIRYVHLLHVHTKGKVFKGEIIASSGNSTIHGPGQPHLHLECYNLGTGQVINPLLLLEQPNLTMDKKTRKELYNYFVDKLGRDDIKKEVKEAEFDRWWVHSGSKEMLRDLPKLKAENDMLQQQLNAYKEAEKLEKIVNILIDQ